MIIALCQKKIKLINYFFRTVLKKRISCAIFARMMLFSIVYMWCNDGLKSTNAQFIHSKDVPFSVIKLFKVSIGLYTNHIIVVIWMIQHLIITIYFIHDINLCIIDPVRYILLIGRSLSEMHIEIIYSFRYEIYQWKNDFVLVRY